MARPRHEGPTPAELRILQVIWDRGPSTVRDVLEIVNKEGPKRAYTSIMSLMNVMVEKNLLKAKPQGRAYVYSAKVQREATLKKMLQDLVTRAFNGSPSALVATLLGGTRVSPKEMQQIREVVRKGKK